MTTPAQYHPDEWDFLIQELDETLQEAATLRGFFDGGMTSAAEHERSVRLSVLREQLRAGHKGDKPLAEGALDSMARAHDDYRQLLTEHRDGKETLARLEAKATILEHKIGRIKAITYSNARLSASGA